MKQISTFMSEISDEFKIVVVEAIRSLCLKFPRKHSVMMNFLSSMLREEVRYLNPTCTASKQRLFNVRDIQILDMRKPRGVIFLPYVVKIIT